MKTTDVYGHVNAIATGLFFIGLIIRLWIGKRRFNRRNLAGMEQFKNYPIAIATTLGERLLNILAALMILFAVFLYLVNYL